MDRVLRVQLIVGLTYLSHRSPRMTFSFLSEMTWKVTFRAIPSTLRKRVVLKWMTPLLLIELSTFQAYIDFFSQVVGRECFLTNPQSRQEILAPLSMRVQMSTAFKVCDGSMS